MRRNRTIIATRLGLALNILEMIAVIIATFIMTILGLVFKELVESFNGESGIYIFFKIGGVSIIFAIFVLVAIISLMAAGKKVKITADYSAEDYKNKSILHKLYIVFNFIVVAILTAIAAAFVIAVLNIYSIITALFAVLCLSFWVAITILLNLDMKEAKSKVTTNAISNISKSNYGQKINSENINNKNN